MGKKKTDTMELRFYEVPQNEYVLALLGDNWVRHYGHDAPNLHFHNLMEIGYCRNGVGILVLDEEQKPYQSAMVSAIPCNFPHTTISDAESGPSFWEYLFFDPAQVVAEMYPCNEVYQRNLVENINASVHFIGEWENHNFAMIVKMIMEEMRTKRNHYGDSVKGLMFSLIVELLRMGEKSREKEKTIEQTRKNTGVTQISEAIAYVQNYYMQNIRVENLAKECHMSETHFRRRFEGCMNMSPVDYINLVRIQKACDLMKKSNDSMDVVAQKVGFATTSTFNRNFKKYLNTSPYQWKINPENYEHKLLNYRISALKGW
jgi:AraC-like DNA-binding protein